MSRALGPRPPVASGNAALAWLLIATAWGLAGLAWLAWAAARPGTPTPLVAVTSGVLIAVLGVAAVVVWRVVARRTTRPGDPVAALSRDRSVRQLKQASVGQTALRLRPSLTATPVPCDIGLLLGRLRQPGGRGPDLFTSWEDTVLAFMGPRSGKTTSVRADLWAATAELRAASGSGLWVFDPQRITAAGQRWWWNPLAGMITVEAAHRLAGHFVLTVDDSTKRDIWGPAAQELLTSLLLAAATSRRTLRDVSRWLDDPGSPTPAGLTDAAMRAPRRHAERSGGRLDPPMVLVLDEAANICRIADLPDLYSHLGGRAMIPVTILQSYEQGVTVWGEPGMAAMWGSATKKLIGAGVDRWCPQWWRHAEAITRLTALWQSREAMRLQPGTGIANWLRDHLDPQLPILLGRGGPFAQCSEDEHIDPASPQQSPPQPATVTKPRKSEQWSIRAPASCQFSSMSVGIMN